MRERNAAANAERARGRPSAAALASRVGYSDLRCVVFDQSRRTADDRRGPMFRPVSSKPDLIAQEHEMLELWRERQTFAASVRRTPTDRAGASSTGRSRPTIPMGVHHAWGRAYKDLYQRFRAMLGDGRALAERLRLPGPLGRGQRRARPRTSPTSTTSRQFGIAEFVNLCKQRVLTYAARQTEQSIRLGHVDGLERPGGAASACATSSTRIRRRGHDARRRRARSPTPSRCSSAASACPRSAAPTSRSATRTTT